VTIYCGMQCNNAYGGTVRRHMMKLMTRRTGGTLSSNDGAGDTHINGTRRT
jgi:hypothetical protein